MDIPEDISAAEMYRELMEQIRGKGRCYLLLDEIQEVKGWERCVNSLLNHQAAHVTGIREKSLFFAIKFPKSLIFLWPVSAWPDGRERL